MSDNVGTLVKRTCRWCGRTFKQRRGEAKRRGGPDCEPPLIPRADTVKVDKRERHS